MLKTLESEKLKAIIAPLVPDLETRLAQYKVDTSEVDEELLGIFLEQMQMDIDGMNAAFASQDMPALAKKAHSIKGMGGTIDMPELSVLAAETELAAKQGEADRLQSLAQAMNACFDLFKQAVEN